VHGEKGEHDLVLRKTGTVWITLDGDRRHEEIDDKGQAEFKNIPAPFRGKTVPIWIEANGFEASEENHTLAGSGVSVLARRTEQTVSGRVVDVEGKPVANAVVSVDALSTRSDGDGHFSFQLGREHRDSLEALISAPGYIQWRGKLTPNSGDATVQLKRKE